MYLTFFHPDHVTLANGAASAEVARESDNTIDLTMMLEVEW